jgi:cell division protein FtsW (lipid II flippase)
MNTSSLSLFIVAAPPIVGSFIVLALAAVGWGVWITHLLAIFLACCLGLAGSHVSKLGNRQNVAFAVVMLTLTGLAISLLGDSTGPERWIPIGPLRLYVAPLLLPSFIAACSVFLEKDGKYQVIPFAAVLVASLLLALQPDASQVLGLLVAAAVVIVRYQLGLLCFGAIVFPLALLALWAFLLPDRLAPVPHVEEVFALAFGHSLFAGIAIITSAIALIVGLLVQSVSGSLWLSAVAAYYIVLFLCSTTGITPAPLVGYGAGPILGYGLVVGLLGWFKHQSGPYKSMQPTANAATD